MSIYQLAKKVYYSSGLAFFRDTLRSKRHLEEIYSNLSIPAISNNTCKTSKLKIDIVIPVIDKDAETLRAVIESAKKYIRHPIGSFYLVSPQNSPVIKSIALETNCIFIDEAILVDSSPQKIQYMCNGINRAGWAYQQLLKWSGAKFCKNRYYLVIDSDTVFIRPQAFEYNGRIVFDHCDFIHKPYFEAFTRLFGIKPKSTVSFTTHHALIDTELMQEIFEYIENKHNKPWHKAVIDTIDQKHKSSISDYDNYGLFVTEKHPETMAIRYWANLSLQRDELVNLRKLEKRFSRLYNTISFHSWNTD